MKCPGSVLWDVFDNEARIHRNEGREERGPCVVDAGHLLLPSGKLVVSDPFLDPWNEPFSFQVSPGTYPVLLSMTNDEPEIVMVRFGETRPVHWQAADPPGFGVDSATGCLMDRRVARFLRKRAIVGKYDRYSRMFDDALHETDDLSASCILDQSSGANVVLFRTLGGDGYFSSYVGKTAEGLPSCLIIDMSVDVESD